MPRISSKTFWDSGRLESLGRTPAQPGEYLVIAAGGIAMLLVVGLFDLLGLLP